MTPAEQAAVRAKAAADAAYLKQIRTQKARAVAVATTDAIRNSRSRRGTRNV